MSSRLLLSTDYYRKKGRLHVIKGEQDADKITDEVDQDDRATVAGIEGKALAVVCKSSNEIEKMRKSGRILRQVLNAVKAVVAPGVSTMDLERVAEKKIRDLGAKPAFKGYYDYPCVLCTSVNDADRAWHPVRKAGAEVG